MGEEPEVKAGEAAPAALEEGAGKAATPSGKTYTQQQMDELAEKIRLGERKRIEAEKAEERRLSEMTEAQKLQAKAEKAELDRAAALTELEFYKRRDAVSRKAGDVPVEFIESAINAFDGEEFDMEAVAEAAKTRWESVVSSRATIPVGGASQRPQPPKTGGTPATQGGTNFSGWTSEQIADHARKLGGTKGLAFLKEAQAYRSSGGSFAR